MGTTGRPAQPPTPEQVDAMCKSLRKSNFRETAYADAGVSPYIARNWVRAGRVDQAAGVESVYSDLVTRIDLAEAQAESELIGGIREAGFQPFIKSESDKGTVYERGSWQALAWIAERRGQKNWGVKKTLDVTIDRDRALMLEVAEKVLDHDAFDKLLAALIEAEESSRTGERDTGETSGD